VGGVAAPPDAGAPRRRIALARALVADADILLVDEPTAHLDAASAQRVMDALTGHARDHGLGLLAIVHPGVDLGGFDRVLELRDGAVAPAAYPSSSPWSKA
jgi:ABC-type transport system involved in cytochrome bd biosynthesis fused ATPase/permease subunit